MLASLSALLLPRVPAADGHHQLPLQRRRGIWKQPVQLCRHSQQSSRQPACSRLDTLRISQGTQRVSGTGLTQLGKLPTREGTHSAQLVTCKEGPMLVTCKERPKLVTCEEGPMLENLTLQSGALSLRYTGIWNSNHFWQWLSSWESRPLGGSNDPFMGGHLRSIRKQIFILQS